MNLSRNGISEKKSTVGSATFRFVMASMTKNFWDKIDDPYVYKEQPSSSEEEVIVDAPSQSLSNLVGEAEKPELLEPEVISPLPILSPLVLEEELQESIERVVNVKELEENVNVFIMFRRYHF